VQAVRSGSRCVSVRSTRVALPRQKCIEPLQVRVEPGIGRIQADRFLGGLARFVRPLQPNQYSAELIADVNIAGVALGRGAVSLLGTVEIAAAQQEIPEMRLEPGIGQFCGDSAPSRLDGLVEAARPAQQMAEIDLKHGDFRAQRHRLADLAFGRRDVACIDQHCTELRVAVRIFRLNLELFAASR
jgi:hypothetical protein